MAKIGWVRDAQPDNTQKNDMLYSGYYDQVEKSKNRTDQTSRMPNLYLYGSFDLGGKQTLEAYINADYTDNRYIRNYEEGGNTSNTNVKEDFYKAEAYVSYSKPLKHHNLITAQLYHFHKISMSDYSGDYYYRQHLWSGESIFFIDYNQRLGKKILLRVHPGVSFLEYRLNRDKQIDHISPRLNVSVIYEPASGQQLYAGNNIGNTYPQLNTINNVEQNVDFLQIKKGNPNMDKSNLYNPFLYYSLLAGKFRMQTGLSYYYSSHSIVNDYYTEGDKLIDTYRSDAAYQRLKSLLSVAYKVNRNFRIKADADWTKTVLSGSVNESCHAWSASMQTTYYLKDFSFNLYGKTRQTLLDESRVYSKLPAKYGIFVNWDDGNWKAEIGVQNPFTKNNRQINYVNSSAYDYYATTRITPDQQTAYLKIIYTLDFGKKTSRVQKEVDTEIDSAIMKTR